jgi:hypothetical protein
MNHYLLFFAKIQNNPDNLRHYPGISSIRDIAGHFIVISVQNQFSLLAVFVYQTNQIGGRINGIIFNIGYGNFYPVSVFKPAQLFKITNATML